jgi:predicted Rossmann fold nucleotide-binding protein DprA/Smf involved in DNA uptake
VVACSEESGGKWAGAIEALRQGFPVFARHGNSQRPGNEALIELGALAIEDDFSLLMHSQTTPVVSEPVPILPDPPPIEKQDQATPARLSDEIFAAVAALLLKALREPMTAKDVRERTELPKALVNRWLKQLVAEGRAVKIKTLYHATTVQRDVDEHPSLFRGR